MYLTLFLTFLKIGVGTIGGGYAMLPLIQREVVDRGWLSKEDFIDLFSVAQSLPGIFAVNISIFVGYKLKKSMGSVVCALGTILPSFLIILLIATFFTRVQVKAQGFVVMADIPARFAQKIAYFVPTGLTVMQRFGAY